MFYRYEHYMSISHMALIVAMEHNSCTSVCRVHRRMLFISTFLLHQLYPTCLVLLIWLVSEIEDKWLFSCCFVGCCFQDLFNITFLCNCRQAFFFIRLVNIHSVELKRPQLGKKVYFILSDRVDTYDRWPVDCSLWLRKSQIAYIYIYIYVV